MSAAEYVWVFVRAGPDRITGAERLVLMLPHLLGGASAECDLRFRGASRYLTVIIRGAAASFPAEVRARLAFWGTRAGARAFAVDELGEEDRRRFHAELNLCERVVRGVPLTSFPDGVRRFFREAGVGEAAAPAGRPVLAVDAAGPGGRGIGYRPDTLELFVAGAMAPPLGDEIDLQVRVRGSERPLDGWGRVVHVRRPADARPGSAAGFTLRVEGPPALHDALATGVRDDRGAESRAAPRFPVRAPVRVTPVAPTPPTPAAEPPRARIEYATDQQLAADWIENLSHGGAFVRTPRPLPVGTRVVLELGLPDGVRLDAPAEVVFATQYGIGVRFHLAKDQEATLAAAIARISARPRRAMVVDDDELARRMLTDALRTRGFEVLNAASAEEALRSLFDEILTLDLLVTDVYMPEMDGEELVRLIRKTGGEADLAIVAVSGRLEPGQEAKLEAAGADAVLEKSLGPDLVAQAADAALERKRLSAAP